MNQETCHFCKIYSGVEKVAVSCINICIVCFKLCISFIPFQTRWLVERNHLICTINLRLSRTCPFMYFHWFSFALYFLYSDSPEIAGCYCSFVFVIKSHLNSLLFILYCPINLRDSQESSFWFRFRQLYLSQRTVHFYYLPRICTG